MTDTPFLKELMDTTDKGDTREIVVMKGCTPGYTGGVEAGGLMTHDTEDDDAFSERVKKRYIKSNDTTDELANDTEEIEELEGHINRCNMCQRRTQLPDGRRVCPQGCYPGTAGPSPKQKTQ